MQAITNIAFTQVRASQSHSAVDVVSDSARGNHAVFFGIGCANSADRKAIAEMNIRHGQRILHNSRQVGNVCDLSQRIVFPNLGDEVFVRINAARNSHAALSRDFPEIIVNFP